MALRRFLSKALFDVVLDQRLEFFGDGRAAQGERFLAVDEHRRGRRLAGAGQADADVGMLAFAGPVDDAAHHRDLHLFDARIARLPHRHLRAQVIVDLLGEILERRAVPIEVAEDRSRGNEEQARSQTHHVSGSAQSAPVPRLAIEAANSLLRCGASLLALPAAGDGFIG